MNKPVAWLIQTKTAHQFTFKEPTTIPIDAVVEPLYTHPVKELTEEKIMVLAREMGMHLYDYEIDPLGNCLNFAKEILRKASEK